MADIIDLKSKKVISAEDIEKDFKEKTDFFEDDPLTEQVNFKGRKSLFEAIDKYREELSLDRINFICQAVYLFSYLIKLINDGYSIRLLKDGQYFYVNNKYLEIAEVSAKYKKK